MELIVFFSPVTLDVLSLLVVKFHQRATTRRSKAPVGPGFAVLAASAAIFDALRRDVLEALPSEQGGPRGLRPHLRTTRSGLAHAGQIRVL